MPMVYLFKKKVRGGGCLNRGNELQSERTSCVNRGNELHISDCTIRYINLILLFKCK